MTNPYNRKNIIISKCIIIFYVYKKISSKISCRSEDIFNGNSVRDTYAKQENER